MNERDYLDHFAKVTGDNVPATIESRNDDGSYMVREVASRASVRASPSNPVDQFAIRARVLISRPYANRSVLGAGATIISRAPRDQKGLAGTVPAETRNFSTRPIILSVDPDPLIIEAGGEAGEQTIIGRNLTGEPQYVKRTPTAQAPDVENESDPVVEPERVVINIAAAADSPLGLFSLTIGDARARDALRIIPSGAPSPPWFVVSGEAYTDDDETDVLWFLNPQTMEIVARIEVVGQGSYGLTSIGGVVYWITKVSNGNYLLHAIDLHAGTHTSGPMTAGLSFHPGFELAANAGKLFISSVATSPGKGLWRFNTDGSGGTRVWVDGNPSLGRYAVLFDGANIYLSLPDTVRLDGSFTQVAASASGNDGSRLLSIGGYIVASSTSSFGDRVIWMDPITLSIVRSFTPSGSRILSATTVVGDRIYFANSHPSSKQLFSASVDGLDVDTVATLTYEPQVWAWTTDGTDILYADRATNGLARRMDTNGNIIASSAPLDTLVPTGDVELLQAIYVPG